MEVRKELLPYEIRVIKINKNAIIELLFDILNSANFGKLFFVDEKTDGKYMHIEPFFDWEQSEMLILMHNDNLLIDKEYINNLPIKTFDSLYTVCTDNIDRFLDCDMSPDTLLPIINNCNGCAEANKKESHKDSLLSVYVHPQHNHSAQGIRLSHTAIEELLWEYFMEYGNVLMALPENDGCNFSTIYHMCIGEMLETLTLYVMNLENAAFSVFEEIDAYCDQYIHCTAVSLTEKCGEKQHYVSFSLPRK